MRRVALTLVAVAAAASLAPAAGASLYCADLGPIPGYGPVCSVQCALGSADVDLRDPVGTAESVLIVACPA